MNAVLSVVLPAMWSSWEDEIDGLRSWEELTAYLAGGWTQVRDGDGGLVLTTHFDELLVDEPPGGTATQRRGLHRLGFRRRDDRCWSWESEPPTSGELPPPPRGFPPLLAAAWTSSQRDEAIDRARSDMAVRVVREVYRCPPERLVVTVVDDDELDDWDAEDDDDAAVPGLDCAALEARFGPARRGAG